MANVHRTAQGKGVDIDRLKLMNETTVAVGNAGVNARGDVVKGNKVIKTREQITQENYKIRGNNVVKDANNRRSAEIEPDFVNPPLSPLAELTTAHDEPTVVNQPPLENEPRGGLASAVSRGKNVADAFDTQRKRI
jgi:hypothetical protein